jgi:hypothetical protein
MLSKTTFANIVSIVYTLGYNDFDIFEKIKSSDPVVDAKLNSKTRLQQIIYNNQKVFKKTLNLMLLSNTLKNLEKGTGNS